MLEGLPHFGHLTFIVLNMAGEMSLSIVEEEKLGRVSGGLKPVRGGDKD